MNSQASDNLPSEQFDRLFLADHSKLRELASYLKRRDASATLNVTALINEAYLKLREALPEVQSELHLRRIAGRAMRQILADAARRRAAQKRGGDGSIAFLQWDENMDAMGNTSEDVLALDAALTELEQMDPRQAEMVEAHFFGGLSWPEVAEYLGTSLATVEREWRIVRAWLAEQVRHQ